MEKRLRIRFRKTNDKLERLRINLFQKLSHIKEKINNENNE